LIPRPDIKPREMLIDLRIAAKRLAQGEADVDLTAAKGGNADSNQPTVLVIEPNVEMQNVLREGLKKLGYRVLIISSPSEHSTGSGMRPRGLTASSLMPVNWVNQQ